MNLAYKYWDKVAEERKTARNAGIVFLVSLVILAFFYGAYYSSWTTTNITVIDKGVTIEMKTSGDEKQHTSKSNTVYLIFTGEGEPFKLENDTLLWQFVAAEQYGQLKIGKKYTVDVIGWRVPWLGWFRRITSVKEYTGE